MSTMTTLPSHSKASASRASLSSALFLFFVANFCYGGCESDDNICSANSGPISCSPGHFRPHESCVLYGVALVGNGSFTTTGYGGLIGPAYKIWPTVLRGESEVECSKEYDTGVAATMYYHYGHGNYYHFFYDTLMPMFKYIHDGAIQDDNSSNAILLTVEHGSIPGLGEGVDWDTDAFLQSRSGYWMHMVRKIFPNLQLLPLSRTLLTLVQREGRAICFRKLFLGLQKTNHSDPSFVRAFVRHVRLSYFPLWKIEPQTNNLGKNFRGIFVQRKGRRRILNIPELATAARTSNLVDFRIVDFQGLSFQQQMSIVQEQSVFCGMQGAGFMNALFLPPGSAVIILFQYGAVSDSFSEFLRPRYIYNRWVNKNKSLSFANESVDPFHDQSNTYVPVNEFINEVRKAVSAMNHDVVQ